MQLLLLAPRKTITNHNERIIIIISFIFPQTHHHNFYILSPVGSIKTKVLFWLCESKVTRDEYYGGFTTKWYRLRNASPFRIDVLERSLFRTDEDARADSSCSRCFHNQILLSLGSFSSMIAVQYWYGEPEFAKNCETWKELLFQWDSF